jgi:predicted permease
MTEEISSFVTWLVVKVSLPCLMAYTILTSFSRDELAVMPRAAAAPLTAILIAYGAGFLIAKLAGTSRERFGQMVVQTAQNNTIFMGLPVNIAMLGEASVPYVLYYYMANTVFFWSFGVYLISGRKSGKGKNFFGAFLTPPMFGIYIGILGLASGVTLPRFALDTMKHVGDLTTPLSMFFIGHVLYRSGLGSLKFDKDVIIGLVSRFVVGPLISLPVFYLFGVSGMMLSVFIIQSFMPVMANGAIVAEQYGMDSEYAVAMTSISTIAALLLLPIVKIIFIS